MIESISIQNFLSIKNEQTLSFIASNKEKGQEADSQITPNWFKAIDGNKKLLKLLILVGENGAGKTNVLQAINYIKEIALSKRDGRSEEIKFLPFQFDEESKSQPTSMSITYYIDNECYQYKFRVNAKNILEEELKLLAGKKSSRIFFRTIDETTGLTIINFGVACDLSKSAQKDLRSTTINNKSVLSAFWEKNIESEVMRKNYDFFENHLSRVRRSSESIADRLFHYENEEDSKMKRLIKQLMKDIQSNIIDYKVTEIAIDIAKEFSSRDMTDNLKEILLKQYPDGIIRNRNLTFIHHTDNGDFELSEGMESDGTMEILKLMILVYDIILGRKNSFVDEVESGIHSKALNFILKMFLMLADNSQLIVATQDLSLMEMDYLRRDSVRWIKKNTFGESLIERINQNKVHKNKNLRNFLYDEMLIEMNEILKNYHVFKSYSNILNNTINENLNTQMYISTTDKNTNNI